MRSATFVRADPGNDIGGEERGKRARNFNEQTKAKKSYDDI